MNVLHVCKGWSPVEPLFVRQETLCVIQIQFNLPMYRDIDRCFKYKLYTLTRSTRCTNFLYDVPFFFLRKYMELDMSFMESVGLSDRN